MNNSQDINLTYIPTHIKTLTSLVDDIVWETGDYSQVQHFIDEIERLQKLIDKGELYEPNF